MQSQSTVRVRDVVPARVTVVTLGARDLGSLSAFYRGLGWKAAIELEDFTAFETRGAVLALFPLESLAADARTRAAPPAEGLRGFTLSINVERRELVEETIEAVRAAGGRVAKEPVDAEWGGRSAYFTDPEENYWEVAWVPPDSRMAGLISRASDR
jgi:predicted lactoylglutathione lyase